jgi:beta-alanine degradation protein BauB
MSSHDPTVTDPDLYHLVFENDRVRVLEYRDHPGDRTHPHRHPDSVMVTLTSFQRRVSSNGRSVDVELAAGQARWVGAQEHVGENTGATVTHTLFIELKEPGPRSTSDAPLGPAERG